MGTAHRNLRAQRDSFVQMLVAYHRRTGHEITVVFDAWGGAEARETVIKTGGVTVVYSRVGQTADSVIKSIVSRRDRRWVVITSDRDVASAVWASSSVSINSDEFRRVISMDSIGTHADDEEEDEVPPGRRHGKLSKRERETRRVLRSLR